MPPSGVVGWLLIFTPPLMFPVPPPFCSVTTFIELSKHWCLYSLPHFMTSPLLLNKLVHEILFVNLSFQHSLTLCRVSVVVSYLLFCLCSSHREYAISQERLCRQRDSTAQLVLGSRRWSANRVPWHQAVAMIPGYSCMILHFISYFNHYHPKRRK